MTGTHFDRECPRCERDRVVSRREAEAVFKQDTVTRQALADRVGATHICTACYATRNDD